MNYNNIEDIPLEEDIDLFITKSIPDIHEYTKIKEAFGGNNIIEILENNDNKIVFRRTKEPLNTIPFNVLIPENFKQYLKQQNLPEDSREVDIFLNKDDLIQESNIWTLANKHRISPYLYYYGIYRKTYFKQRDFSSSIMAKELQNQSYHAIYKIVISEAYDMNIGEYYNEENNDGYNDKQSNKLSEIDKTIANLLMDVLDKLHSKVKVICFDIKPSNCVINLDPFDVKLIDLDADWCRYNPILKKRGTDEQKKLIKFLSIMTLANHFLHYCNWNIFSDYLNANRDNLYILKSSLQILFCELTNDYKYMSEHYLYSEKLNRTNNIGVPRQKPNTCEELFNEMFEDMFKLNYERNNTINTNISSKKRTVVSFDSKSSKRKKGGTKKKKRSKKKGGNKKKKSIRKGGTKKKKIFRFKDDDIDSEMRGILEPNSILNFYKNTEPKSISMYNLLEEGTLDKSLKEKLTNKPVSKPKSILKMKKGGQNPDDDSGCTDRDNSVNEISVIEPNPNDSFDPNDSNFIDYSFNLDNSNDSLNLNDSNNSLNNSGHIFGHPIYHIDNDSINNSRLTDCEDSPN